LAEMAENDIEPRVGVEQTRAHQTQGMDRGLVPERPNRTEQPGMALINLAARQRIARMQIKRHIEPLDHGPERPILRQVVIDDVVRTAPLRETVDQRAAKAKVLDATLELARGAVRI